MGYLHIPNLYADQSILMMKECYALEKIHGTSAHITWDSGNITFFSGGEKHTKFVALFDEEYLRSKFVEVILSQPMIIYGEAYGGSQQKMAKVYGPDLKFIAFDVKIGDYWLDVPVAHKICTDAGIEFVDYNKITTDLSAVDFERDRPSAQALRNGMGSHIREGVVLRPLVETFKKTGERIIAKHKRDEFKETNTPRKVVDPASLQVLLDANKIAEEWVTEMRLQHVMDKVCGSEAPTIAKTGDVVRAMLEDVYREGGQEIVRSKESDRAIGTRSAQLFKRLVGRVE